MKTGRAAGSDRLPQLTHSGSSDWLAYDSGSAAIGGAPSRYSSGIPARRKPSSNRSLCARYIGWAPG
jgi:hypothetical protein